MFSHILDSSVISNKNKPQAQYRRGGYNNRADESQIVETTGKPPISKIIMAWLTILFPLFQKALPYILCVVLGLWLYHKITHLGGSATDTSVVAESVVSVDSGNQLTIKAGLLGRKTRSLTLYGIEIPDAVSTQAADNLKRLVAAGDSVRVEIIEGRKRLTDISGVVSAENGVNCCLDQLRRGLAQTSVSRKDFISAQKEAQKNKLGIWVGYKATFGEEEETITPPSLNPNLPKKGNCDCVGGCK